MPIQSRFAQSGSGKSYTTKVEILRQLMQGTKVIVIDPEREYKNFQSQLMARISSYRREQGKDQSVRFGDDVS
jgi:DNA helicase HerA-like ATPase